MSQSQIDAARKQLYEALLQKELLTDQLEAVTMKVKALRNLVAGVELGRVAGKAEAEKVEDEVD